MVNASLVMKRHLIKIENSDIRQHLGERLVVYEKADEMRGLSTKFHQSPPDGHTFLCTALNHEK